MAILQDFYGQFHFHRRLVDAVSSQLWETNMEFHKSKRFSEGDKSRILATSSDDLTI